MSKIITVIAGLADAIISSEKRDGGRAVKGVLRHPQQPPPNVIKNGIRHVQRQNTPLTEQRGWRKVGKALRGSYATKFGTFEGHIEIRGDRFDVLIRNPPTQMRAHNRWQCFHRRAGDWFWIHLHDAPIDNSADAIIRYVEQILTEAMSKT